MMSFIPKPEDKSLEANIERLKWLLSITEGEKHYRPDGSLISWDDAMIALTGELYDQRKMLISIAAEYYSSAKVT